MNKEQLIHYFIERFNEPSTWRGLINIATAAGVFISPSHIEIIVSLGLFAAGAVGAASKDKK